MTKAEILFFSPQTSFHKVSQELLSFLKDYALEIHSIFGVVQILTGCYQRAAIPTL